VANLDPPGQAPEKAAVLDQAAEGLDPAPWGSRAEAAAESALRVAARGARAVRALES
jgi:hypothetical protein